MAHRICNGITDDISPVCSRCEHLTSMLDRKCTAFPSRIPAVIWSGRNKHKQPYPGDHGIQFESIKLREKAVA